MATGSYKAIEGDLYKIAAEAEAEQWEAFDKKAARELALAAGFEGKGYSLKKKGVGRLTIFRDGYEFNSEVHPKYSDYMEDVSMKEFRNMLVEVNKPIPPREPQDEVSKRMWKVLSDLTTVRTDERDIPELEFYLHSPVRLCVRYRENLDPEAWFMNGRENLKMTGFATVQDLAAWLIGKGIRQKKKPKPIKYSPPLYD